MTDRTFKITTYRLIAVDLVGDSGAARRFNSEPGKAYWTITSALSGAIARAVVGDRYRVIRVPPGEPWDYDGRVVACLDMRPGQ